jgi:predicted secreted protein
MESKVQLKEYSTTDFYTTAMLISQKQEVIKVSKEGDNGQIKRFHFNETSAVQKIVMSYINGQLEGNIKEFRNAIETVKGIVWTSN